MSTGTRFIVVMVLSLPAVFPAGARPAAESPSWVGQGRYRLLVKLEPVDLGDVGARIHAFGNLYATLVYRSGDDEFPATADFLFDSSVERVFCAEDAAFLGSRICLGLL